MRSQQYGIFRVRAVRLLFCLAVSVGSCISATQYPNAVALSAFRSNGSAQIAGASPVTLTNSFYQAGSMFLPTAYKLGPKDSFEAFFTYQAQPSAGGLAADGLALVMQNVGLNAADYLGLSGSGLGFFTLTPIPAIGVTFDFFVNAITGSPAGTMAISTPVGVNLAQVIPNLPVFPGTGAYRAVWIQYNGAQRTLQVYYAGSNTPPANPILTTVLPTDLSTLLGGEMYLGITGGTGEFDAIQQVTSFAVEFQTNP